MTDWDKRFVELAKFIARWSKDPDTKVGAVIVRPDKTIASVGFNGFARGVKDDDRLNNKRDKYAHIIHAEVNSLLNTKEESVKGYTMYCWPFSPCDRCTPQIIQAGITRIVFPPLPLNKIHWRDQLTRADNMFKEVGIEVKVIENEKINT